MDTKPVWYVNQPAYTEEIRLLTMIEQPWGKIATRTDLQLALENEMELLIATENLIENSMEQKQALRNLVADLQWSAMEEAIAAQTPRGMAEAIMGVLKLKEPLRGKLSRKPEILAEYRERSVYQMIWAGYFLK